MKLDELVFVVDLNELERDGSIPVALDFTNNFGPCVTVLPDDPPVSGGIVKVVDSEGSLYEATIVEVEPSGRDFTVSIDWASERRTIDRSWSNFHVRAVTGPHRR